MGNLRYMLRPADLIVVSVFVLTQWRVTRSWLKAARQHFAGPLFRIAWAAIFAFDLLLIAGYTFTFAELVSRMRIPPAPAMCLGAATLVYLVVAAIIVWWHPFCKWAARRLTPEADSGRRRMLELTGKAIGVAPLAVIGYGVFVERSQFRVREVDVPFAGLADGLDGLRIAQVSDIHLSAFLSRSELIRVIDATNELRPNLTVVTGDLISALGDPLDDCIFELSRLRSDAGVYGCLGNHERYADAEEYTHQAAARHGITFLRTSSRLLRFGGSALNLVGIDYQRSESKLALPGTARLIVPGALNVMLSHNPNMFPAVARQGYDLTIAGHTHGGQVTVEILEKGVNPASFFTRFVYGLYRSGHAAAYVTRGIGTIGIPARVGAPPEITLLRLRKA